MSLNEFIDSFYKYRKYRLVGARTGKKLGNSWTMSDATKEKYMGCEISAIYTDLQKHNGTVFGETQWFEPIIVIALVGE